MDVEGRCADRLIATVAVVAFLTPLVGCAATVDARSQARPATFTYTCCRAADINPVRHPGDVVRLHWIASPSTPARSQHGGHVRLTASLAGPYASVTDLKAGPVRCPSVVANPILITDQTVDAPVSTLAIPVNAAPGFYNLTTAVTDPAGRTSGSSVVRIFPPYR